MKAISRISDTLGASGAGQRSLFDRTQISQIHLCSKSQISNLQSTDIKSVSIVLYSSLCSLQERSLRTLRFNHFNATGIDMTPKNLALVILFSSVLDAHIPKKPGFLLSLGSQPVFFRKKTRFLSLGA